MQEGKDIYSGSILDASAFRIDPSSSLPLRHGVPLSKLSFFPSSATQPEAIFCPTKNFETQLVGCENVHLFF
jgi:hypothetical protein